MAPPVGAALLKSTRQPGRVRGFGDQPSRVGCDDTGEQAANAIPADSGLDVACFATSKPRQADARSLGPTVTNPLFHVAIMLHGISENRREPAETLGFLL